MKQRLQQENTYRVPKKQWARWPDIAQRVFNSQYQCMANNQDLFRHPRAETVAPGHWDTTAYNAAWIAADGVVTALKDIEAGVGYKEKS